MPIVTTLHTILRDPDAQQRRVLTEVAGLSDRLVVMSKRGAEFLQEIYQVAPEKIDLIPHGIPDLPFVDPSFHKDLFGVEGKIVLLSFGLLSANKGIENVISALPAILAKHPNVVYFIVGATHPHVLRHDGETYRLSLQWLAQEKGVEGQVIFYNRFVSLEELVEFIGAADIYITPYLNPAQIVSGTLAYTVGRRQGGYFDALLACRRDAGRRARRARAVSRSGGVGRASDRFAGQRGQAPRHAQARLSLRPGDDLAAGSAPLHGEFSARPRRTAPLHSSRILSSKPLDKRPVELPPLKLDHLRRMTDDTGMFQHAIFTVPNYHEGYTIDDNARALIVSTLLEELGNDETAGLMSRYFAFVWYAFNAKTGRFRNFMDYQRNWLEENGSDDSHGRTLWALGTVLGHSNTPALQNMAGWVFEKSLPAMLDTTSPRAWAFALIGINEYLQRFAGDRTITQAREELAGRLLDLYRKNRTAAWRWYEESLTYCNAALPHALLMCGHGIPNNDMTEAGLESLTLAGRLTAR